MVLLCTICIILTLIQLFLFFVKKTRKRCWIISIISFTCIIIIIPYETSLIEKWGNNKIKKLDIPYETYYDERLYVSPESPYLYKDSAKTIKNKILTDLFPNNKIISCFYNTLSDYYVERILYDGTINIYDDFPSDFYDIAYTETIHDYDWNFSLFILENKKINIFNSNKIITDVKQKVSNFNNWVFTPQFYWNHPSKHINAITFRVNKTNIITIFCANERIYFLNVNSKYFAIQRANDILKNLTVCNPKTYKEKIKIEINFTFISLIFFTFVIIFILNHIPNEMQKNKYALRMLRLVSTAMIIDIIFIIIQWHLVNTGYFICDYKWETAISITWFSIIFSCISMLYMRLKCEQDFSFDYIIPHRIKLYLNNRKATVQEIKLFIVFICYPLYIISFPYGIFLLIYIIPICVILILLFEIKILYLWITNNKTNSNNSTNFKDYYLILDINKDATTKEIELAYYKALSKTNSTKSKLNIKEAYFILTSKILRPRYDYEFSQYIQSGDFNEYKFSDKKLEYDISLIKNGFNKEQKHLFKLKNINVVFLSLLIYIIIFLIAIL